VHARHSKAAPAKATDLLLGHLLGGKGSRIAGPILEAVRDSITEELTARHDAADLLAAS
jgi:hypothetical protein